MRWRADRSPKRVNRVSGRVQVKWICLSVAMLEKISCAVRTSAQRSIFSLWRGSDPLSARERCMMFSIRGVVRSHSSMHFAMISFFWLEVVSFQLRVSIMLRMRAMGGRKSCAMLVVTSCISKMRVSICSIISLKLFARFSISGPSVVIFTRCFNSPFFTEVTASVRRLIPANARFEM